MTHTCPGGCGAQVPQHQFACKPCWFQLPADMRAQINDNYRRDPTAHRAAMRAARIWYGDQAVTP